MLNQREGTSKRTKVFNMKTYKTHKKVNSAKNKKDKYEVDKTILKIVNDPDIRISS